MHNEIISGLTDIWYVANMKKNLISLGLLIGKSLHIILADSSFKATKGVLAVMNDVQKKNLFYL